MIAGGMMVQEAKEHREAGRQPVLLQARCRKSAWHVFSVELGNISRGGCSIFGSMGHFEVGDVVQLTFADSKRIVAGVRWVTGSEVGVEFQHSLEGAVVHDLARTYGILTD